LAIEIGKDVTRTLVVAVAFLLLSYACARADTLRDRCLGTASAGLPQLAGELKLAKTHLTQGHYRLVLLEAPKIEAGANACIAAGYDVEEFHLMHVYAIIIEAQARLATGDGQGAILMQRGVDEATTLSKAPDASGDVRSMARDAAYGGNLELKALLKAKPGQLFTPPPRAP
jgi:hypothetical protein